MTREEIIRELKYVIEQEKGKTYDTFSTNVRAMAQDCLRFIQEQHNLPLNENGLARCGCGGVPVLNEWKCNGWHISVTCPKCLIQMHGVGDDEPTKQSTQNMRDFWNRAMGVKEADK